MVGDGTDKPWELRPLGGLTTTERASFYEDLVEGEDEEHLFGFGDGDSRLFENPRLEVGVVTDDGTIVPAEKYRKKAGLRDTRVNIYLERYFVQAMPASRFDIQLAVSSRHYFDDRPEPERVAHTLVVRGVMGDYANYLSEPVFRRLKIGDALSLDIAVTFLTDRSTERLLQFLKGPDIRKGMDLIQTYNPIFGTVANYVRGVVESLASAKKNTPITDAHLTFVASPGELSVPLVAGTYLLFQPSTEKDDVLSRSPRYDRDKQKVVVSDGDFGRNHAILRIEPTR